MSITNKFFEFVRNSTSPYHTVNTVKTELLEHGFKELYECDDWSIEKGGRYFVIRGGTSIIAFRGADNSGTFMISATHSDSPSFKVKLSNKNQGAYIRLDTEKYGGGIMYSWLDRPLSVAGRVVLKTEGGIEEKLVDIKRDTAVIPSLAIHLNRSVNDGYKFNQVKDMPPLVGLSSLGASLMSEIAKALGVNEEDIINHDLFLYNRDEGKTFGISNEFILSPRIDDLACVFSSLTGFLSADDSNAVSVMAVFDNEEVGSSTKQGARSTFLKDVLHRISKGESDYLKKVAGGFMVSADNCNALHPNHPELADSMNPAVLGGGVAIKYNANQSYTSDGFSAAVLSTVADRKGIKLQNFYNRADLAGGSTLGSISDTVVSLSTVDIGVPQLGMHSANETCAVKDLADMAALLTAFHSAEIVKSGNKTEVIL